MESAYIEGEEDLDHFDVEEGAVLTEGQIGAIHMERDLRDRLGVDEVVSQRLDRL